MFKPTRREIRAVQYLAKVCEEAAADELEGKPRRLWDREKQAFSVPSQEEWARCAFSLAAEVAERSIPTGDHWL